MKNTPRALVYLKLVGSMALWGATWVSGRIVAQQMHPFSAAFLRFFFASAFLFLLLCRVEGRLPRLPRQSLPQLAFLGFTGVFLYNFLFFTGLSTVGAGRAALIIASVPCVVALGSAIFLRTAVTPAKALGIALSLTGVGVILSGGDPVGFLMRGASMGDLAILGCVVTWAAYTIAGSGTMRLLSPLTAVTWSCLAGNLMLLPAALATGLVPDATNATPVIWAHLVFLGVGATGLAFTWYYDGIQAIGAARASIFINLVPVFATVLSLFILGEPLGMALLAGGAMVVCGVVLANRQKAKQEQA